MDPGESRIGTALWRVLLASRWLVVPLYVGLVGVLGTLLVVFFRELAVYMSQALVMTSESAIVSAMMLIDLGLVANLLLIVIVSSYANFVSTPPTVHTPSEPTWLGTVDFSSLKFKLFGSIAAISGIDLLKRYMAIGDGGNGQALVDPYLFWAAVIHIVFVVSALLMALMDWLEARARAPHG